MKHALAVVAAATLLSSLASAQDQSKASPAELAKEATERARSMNIPKISAPTLTDEQRKSIQSAAENARNRAKDELSKLAERQPFTPESDKQAAPPSDNLAVPKPRILAGRVVVALSSSMPESEWREYMAQLDGKPEAIVILRGFVGGATTVTPTAALVERMARVDATNPKGGRRKLEVVVDPILYRNLGIDRVPAVAWLPGVSDISHCDGETVASAVTVYGTTSVSYALEQINRNGGKVPPEVIKSFKGLGG